MEKKPHIPIAMAQIINPTLMVKAGYWNSLLAESNARMVEIAIASPIQKAIIPSDMIEPRRKHRERLPADRDLPHLDVAWLHGCRDWSPGTG